MLKLRIFSISFPTESRQISQSVLIVFSTLSILITLTKLKKRARVVHALSPWDLPQKTLLCWFEQEETKCTIKTKFSQYFEFQIIAPLAFSICRIV